MPHIAVDRDEYLRLKRQHNDIRVEGGQVRYGDSCIYIKIDTAAAAAGTACSPVKIKSKTDYRTYVADVYGDGMDKSPTESDVTVKILQIATTETVPNNTILFASPLSWDVGGKPTTFWTAEVPRSL